MRSGLTFHPKEKNLKPIDAIVGIKGLTIDSRQVQPGFLFAAFRGSNSDGRAFIPAAVEKGASIILSETGTTLPPELAGKVKLITHDNPRRYFAALAAEFYQKQPETIVAVTGTNGKTSTAYFCQQLWNMLNIPAVSMGTIGICGKGHEFQPGDSLTTPDTVTLHKTLAELAGEGIEAVAMEASSHGLDQYRLDGLKLKAAGFTNLTRDHLDYHVTLDAYYNAKLRLFTELLPSNCVAVLNADIPEFNSMKTVCEARGNRVIDYGKQANALKLVSLARKGYGQEAVLHVDCDPGHIPCHPERSEGSLAGKDASLPLSMTIDFSLIGEFQVYNALCAAGLLIAAGMDAEKILAALPALQPAPGRMELVPGSDKARKAVFVDYAHTPDALEKALEQLRPYTKGNVWVVFGCGGDRDKGKRPEMGNIAKTHADKLVVTDDNPRTENPIIIRREILAACPEAKEIGDRKEAIHYAITQMQQGDVLLIAGKGHEKTQKIGKEVLPFDDVAVAAGVLLS